MRIDNIGMIATRKAVSVYSGTKTDLSGRDNEGSTVIGLFYVLTERLEAGKPTFLKLAFLAVFARHTVQSI